MDYRERITVEPGKQRGKPFVRHLGLPGMRRGSREAHRGASGAIKLLLDENLSRRIVPFLRADFPESSQVAREATLGH